LDDIILRRFFLLTSSKFINYDEIGIITRFIVGAMMLSHNLRKDVCTYIIFDNKVCIIFEGKSMKNVRPDEKSILGILKSGLLRIDSKKESRILPGVIARKIIVEDFLNNLPSPKFFYSSTYGKTEKLGENFSIIFGYPKIENLCILLKNFVPFKIGKTDLYPDQLVVIINNKIDKGEL
jgi:tRNA pseudouridine-54 N-methylase